MNEQLTHWKKQMNPDYLGAYALNPGEDIIVTIKNVSEGDVIGTSGKSERKQIVYFEENGVKPMVLNRTNAKTISKLYRTPYIEQWRGKKIQIYIEHDIKAFGEIVDGIRVRPYIPKEEKPICEECKNELQPYKGRSPQALATYTQKNYGKILCHECAAKLAAQKEG